MQLGQPVPQQVGEADAGCGQDALDQDVVAVPDLDAAADEARLRVGPQAATWRDQLVRQPAVVVVTEGHQLAGRGQRMPVLRVPARPGCER